MLSLLKGFPCGPLLKMACETNQEAVRGAKLVYFFRFWIKRLQIWMSTYSQSAYS